jgi:hypothetical protein
MRATAVTTTTHGVRRPGEQVRREPLTWSSAACDLLAPATRSELSWAGCLGNADFWARTLQNWQSEFLAVGAMCVLSIYLRQRGSSQSKPVG